MSKQAVPETLDEARTKLREATDHTRLAYLFCCGAYTAAAFQAVLAATEALDQCIAELARSAHAIVADEEAQQLSLPD
jgi:hypothetical protein